MTFNITSRVEAIQTNYINPVINKMMTWKEYVSNLVMNYAKKDTSVSKTAQVFAEVKPMENTPSQEHASIEIPHVPHPGTLAQLSLIMRTIGLESTTTKVINAVASVQSLSETELPWNEAFHAGGTGYVDGVRPSDMSKSVMWGIDRWNRPYVALKVCDFNDDGSIRDTGVETLFQRLPGRGDIWTSGAHHLSLPHGASLIRCTLGDKEFNVFNELIKGKEVTYTAWDGSDVKVKLAD